MAVARPACQPARAAFRALKKDAVEGGECYQMTHDARAVLQGPRGPHPWGEQRVSAYPFSCCVSWWEATLFASQPTPKIKLGTSPQGMPSTLWKPSWNIVETDPGMVQPLCRLALRGESCSLIPLVGAFYGSDGSACFALSACNELLLAPPGWLFM